MSTNTYFSIPANALPNVTLVNTVTIDFPYVHFQRVPTEYILYVIVEGVMYLTENDIEYTLVPGDLILLDPSRCHFGREASRCFYYYIHFQFDGIKEITMTPEEYQQFIISQRKADYAPNAEFTDTDNAIILPKYSHIEEDAFHILENIAHEIQFSFHTPLEFHQAKTCCQLLDFFISWERTLTDIAFEAFSRHIDSLALQIMAYLKIYYPDKLTSEDIEKHFYKNFNYINRVFKKSTGYTVFQWLNNYRVAQAKLFLLTKCYNHEQIAEKVGLSNEFYFSRVFKKETGMTPSEYKKMFSS